MATSSVISRKATDGPPQEVNLTKKKKNAQTVIPVFLLIASTFWIDNCLLSSDLLVFIAANPIPLKILALTIAR